MRRDETMTQKELLDELNLLRRERARWEEVEEALRESERRMRLSQEVGHVGAWDWDPNTGELLWSDETYRILGFTPGEVTPSYELFLGLVYPEDRAALAASVAAALEKATPYRMDCRLVRRDGTERVAETIGEVEFDADGQPVRMFGMFADITERRRSEEALRRNRRRLAEAERIAKLGHWELDPSTNEMVGSDEFFAIFGIGRDEATLEACLEVIHPEDRKSDAATIMRGIEHGEDWDVVHRLVCRDGTEKTVRAVGQAITNEAGETIRLLGTAQDVTERVRMETELFKTQKLESLGVLAGGIAHDFNNLLVGILGNISLVRLSLGSDASLHEPLLQAESAARQATGLTRQLLTFSKGGRPVKEMISLGELVEESVGFTLRGSSILAKVSISPDLSPIKADRGQIAQTLNNLLINAKQAMPTGGTVRVGVDNVVVDPEDSLPLDAQSYAMITVRDEGSGIPADMLSKIFDPYFSTKKEGSGLGLASAYSIAKSHDGHIEVESTLGGGTTFRVYLPASRTAAMDKAAEVSKPPRRGTGRVLVMDDEELVRKLLKRLLTSVGYEVVVTPEGRKAVEAYGRARDSGSPFDVTILDLTVRGGMGGQEALKGLLEIDPDARVIVSSGYSASGVVSDYEEHGFCDVLAKPYEVSDLIEVLERVLGEKVSSGA